MLRIGIAALVLAACATAQRPAEPDLRKLLEERSARRLSEAQLRELFAPDVVHVDEKGARIEGAAGMLAEFAPQPEIVQFREALSELRVRLAGDAALAIYRIDGHLVLGGQPVTKALRISETFVRDGERWRSVAYHETVIPLQPVAHADDRAAYDDYAGRYELFPGFVYVVRREGDKLYFGATQKRELVGDAPGSFVIAGDQYRVTFLREGGRVTRLRLVEFPGVEYEAKKLP